MGKLKAGYLFPEINRIKNAHLEKKPDAAIISLGIGDTTEPIPAPIIDGMISCVSGLRTPAGYAKYGGYGPGEGQAELREKIASRFYPGGAPPTLRPSVSWGKCGSG